MLRDEGHEEPRPRARTHVSCALGTYAFSSADAVAGRALRAAMRARLKSSTELRSAHTACVVLRLKPMSYGLGGTRPVSSQSRSPTCVWLCQVHPSDAISWFRTTVPVKHGIQAPTFFESI